jgi:hypothetical protein
MTRSTARCRAARFPGFGTEIADSRAVSFEAVARGTDLLQLKSFEKGCAGGGV